MTLSQPQILELYTFVQKHYVDWYDVQTELVDHLANGIELQWQENPKLNFHEALQKEFKKFGIMGFSDVVEQKHKALDRRYRKLMWQEFKNYLRLPKIILTLFFIWLLYMLIHGIENKNIVIVPLMIIICGIPWIYLIRNVRSIKKRKQRTGKKWLFENITLQLGGLIHVLNIGIYAPLFFNRKQAWHTSTEVLFSVSIVLFLLLMFIAIVVITPHLKEKLSKEYPEYNFS